MNIIYCERCECIVLQNGIPFGEFQHKDQSGAFDSCRVPNWQIDQDLAD